MRARHAHALLGPEADDGLEVLLQAHHPLALRGAEALELHLAVAEAGAEDHAPARHHVEGGDLLGDVERLVQREQDDPRQQAAARRLDHEPRQQGELLVLLQRPGGVVHAGGEDVVAQLVREPRLGAEVCEARVHVLAAAELAADEEAVFHGGTLSALRACARAQSGLRDHSGPKAPHLSLSPSPEGGGGTWRRRLALPLRPGGRRGPGSQHGMGSYVIVRRSARASAGSRRRAARGDQSRVQWCSARSNLVGGLSVAATLR